MSLASNQGDTSALNPRQSACEGKHAFPSAVMAQRAVRRWKREEAYRCPYCGGWHISGPKKRGVARQ